MWNAKENREGVVAVAVYKEKSSQYALKWAIDNNLSPIDKPLKLVHVVQRPPSPSHPLNSENNTLIHQERDAEATQVLFPYRCYCSLRQVQFETVILQDLNVARALTNFVSVNGVETLLLGSRKKSISRIFKNSNIRSKVLKWAPDYCHIYIISKGKISAMRPASRSAPNIVPAIQTTRTPNSESIHEKLYDELSLAENDNSLGDPERVSMDSNYVSFYENMGHGFSSAMEPSYSDNTYTEDENPITETSSLMSLHTENVEDEVRRLKIEPKQIVDMCHTPCKEALVSQQWTELEEWKTEQEKRTKDVAEVEKEKAIFKEAKEAATEQEVENKILTTKIKAMIEAEEKPRALHALGCSHSVLKYNSLFHIFIVVVFIVLLVFLI